MRMTIGGDHDPITNFAALYRYMMLNPFGPSLPNLDPKRMIAACATWVMPEPALPQ
jgi:hypothetical protein